MLGAIGALGGIAGADAEVAVMIDGLRRQERALSTIAAAMAAQSIRMPPLGDSGWRGPARGAYDVVMRRLQASIDRAADAVSAALHDTKTAIVILETRSS